MPVLNTQRGFSLVELMVSLVLGLLVISAAGSLFLSNQRIYGATESINRIQENQRAAFELLARDVREAGGNPCTRNIVNMLDTSKPGGSYYTDWMDGVSGRNGTGPAASDEITLSHATDSMVRVTGNDNPSAEIEVETNAGFETGDILMVCNADVSSIFQVTNTANNKLGHNAGNGNPGNLEKPFQRDQVTFDRNTAAQTGYCYLPPATGANPNCLNAPSGSPAMVVRPTAVRWFLADNGRGGTSLYRQVITNGGANVGVRGEIAEGVTDLQITYKVGPATDYVDAAAGLAWGDVTAVNVRMVFQAVSGALSRTQTQGTDGQALTRTLNDYIVLRNHQDIR